MSSDRISFEGLPSTVGQVVYGAPFVLSEEDIENFHKGTWLDRAYPEDSVPDYPETLIEGFHLLSMLDAIARFSSGHADDEMWGLNYGLDSVRFVSQVHRGDRIVPTFETLAVDRKDDGYKLLRRCTFTVEGQPRPAMIADWWTFVLPTGVHEKNRRTP